MATTCADGSNKRTVILQSKTRRISLQHARSAVIERALMRTRPLIAASCIGVIVVACGVEQRRTGFGSAPDVNQPDASKEPTFVVDAGRGCEGLECQIASCEGGATTTLKGKVFDPAGANPLYDVIVYIPSGNDPETLPPIEDSTANGVTCETCDSVVMSPLRSALTDGTGTFVLKDVPVQAKLPVVIQVGKWRRLVHVDVTKRCDENMVPDRALTLPKNGSEGDMPQIAVTTGELDALECLLRGIGVDEKEFVEGNDPGGHVHLFKGMNGGMGKPVETFWNDASRLRKYDMVLLSCEGGEYKDNKGGDEPGARGSMHEYLNAGGKVFATHFHYVWFESSPAVEFQNLAQWKTPKALAQYYEIEQTFPKGEKLAQWLGAVGASSVPGRIELANPAVLATKANDPSVTWISSQLGEPMYFTVNTPMSNPDGSPTKPEARCGRAVITGLHVAAKGAPATLSDCSIERGALNPQQAALEFLFFDLSSCVTSDKVEPKPPK
jgi:hypothetical protein